MTVMRKMINRLRAGQLPLADVRRMLAHPAPLVRINALETLVERAAAGEDVLEDLRAAALDPANQARLKGKRKSCVADVAVAGLLRLRTDRSAAAAQELIDARDEPDRSDLLRHLQSQGLLGETGRRQQAR